MDLSACIFQQFPAEVWVMIMKKMKNYNDIERACQAMNQLHDHVTDYILELKHYKVLQCLFRKGVIDASNALNIRPVCKNWCDSIDDFCFNSRDDIEWRWWTFPHVTLQLPLNQNGANLIQDLCQNDRNPLIGGRLYLELCNPTPDVKTVSDVHDQVEAAKVLWKHVDKLALVSDLSMPEQEILLRGQEGFEAVFGPFLARMENVTSITSLISAVDIEPIHCLPSLCPLKYLTVHSRVIEDFEDSQEWTLVLENCCSTLKSLSVLLLSNGLQLALKSLDFPCLEEFRAEHYNYETDCVGELCTMLTGLTLKPSRFPNLKLVGIPLPSRLSNRNNLEDAAIVSDVPNRKCIGEALTKRLVDISNSNKLLESLEIYESIDYCISLQNYPISISLLDKGSVALKRLRIKTLLPIFSNDVLHWGISLLVLFPSIRLMELNTSTFVKFGSDWELVSK